MSHKLWLYIIYLHKILRNNNILGGLWYVLNFFFRTGVHQLSPKTYGDGMKEFTVSFKFILQKVLTIFSFSAIQKCLAAKMFATMNFYHFQWIVYGP